eukprot:7291232-Prymnesium_polylepis.1
MSDEVVGWPPAQPPTKRGPLRNTGRHDPRGRLHTDLSDGVRPRHSAAIRPFIVYFPRTFGFT